MAHPLRSETNASQAAKLKAMTEHYGGANPKDNVRPGVEKYKGEGPEEDVGFGADNSKPKLHGARISRMTKPTNPYATYKKGGRVKHRDSGGDVMDSGDIESADIDQKLASHRRGGKVRHRASGGAGGTAGTTGSSTSSPLSSASSTTSSPSPMVTGPQQAQYLEDIGQQKRGGRVHKRAHGGRVRGEMGGPREAPAKVKMGGKYATQSSEPSPTPVDNRAHGGRMGDHKKGKGGNHVNIMIAPQHGQQPMAPPVSAMPMPPPMPKAPMPPPGAPPGGMPPGAGMPPGGPGGAMMPPPGAMPPGMMPPRKQGGRVMKKSHPDEAQDMSLIKRTVKEQALKPHGSMRAAGGRMTAGAATGEGRLEKIAMQKRSGHMKSQEV